MSEGPSLFYVLWAVVAVVGLLGLFALSWVKSSLRIEQDRGPAQEAVEAQPRRFSPPWSVEELEACFVVIDSAWQKVAYVYFEEDPGRRSAAKLLDRDEARRIAGEHRQAAGAIAEVYTVIETVRSGLRGTN